MRIAIRICLVLFPACAAGFQKADLVRVIKSDSCLPKGAKYAGRKVTWTANGPGTLSIKCVYNNGAKSTSRYAGIEGGDRYFSSVHWNSPDSIALKGRLPGGSLYRASGGNAVHLTETSSSASITVTGPGKIVFTA